MYLKGQFGSYKQDFGYVTVREGAHMFYWLFYTTAPVEHYTERPLIVWLQGGPGGSSTGIGNFQILGPLDTNLQERNHTWIKNFNVIFLDNPVGTGFSYVDDPSLLTTTNKEIALDFVSLMRGFYEKHPEFETVPLYIYGQSYGGKMAVDMAIQMVEAQKAETIRSNLRGFAMGNAWISPVDAVLTWAPQLLAAGLVDDDGYNDIQVEARETERLFNLGAYVNSTIQWGATQQMIFHVTSNVDFYNILTKMPAPPNAADTRTASELARDMMIYNKPYMLDTKQTLNLNTLMNTLVKQALQIPEHVTWGQLSMAVFNTLNEDFMKPVTEGKDNCKTSNFLFPVEKILNETDLIVTKYNGNLDLICNTPVVTAVVVAAGLGVLIWWLVTNNDVITDNDGRYETIILDGEGFGNVNYMAAFTRIPEGGDVFWWFYPTLAEIPTQRPIVLWLDGVTGLPPSLLANFGMFGPFDLNLNRRNNSWIDQYNLLFMDGPLGSGFSTVADNGEIPQNLETNTNHTILTLKSFYEQNSEFYETPLYIFGQGYGGQMAVMLALELNNMESFSPNLKGIVLGNAIISPALVITKLGFYLEELAYVDFSGRAAIESLSNEINELVDQGKLESAYDHFLTLDKFINENAGAVAVNLEYIVEKVTRESNDFDFGQTKALKEVTNLNIKLGQFMDEVVAPALGISNPNFDRQREAIIQSFKENFMKPATNKVEEVLDNTNISVTIYNGNLDAVSNTPGQLQWINSLQWDGQEQFLNSSRQTLIINNQIEGYFRETDKFTFYWINVAGLSAPLDNPVAMRRAIQRIMDS
ncbi:unnamed protein product [Diatraea saccharalis]|uniref:Retinoid-inducible serine carboxypeptidase n=1 Tax=Diatraea saccharalis TaxID=40085 RepID=A0A9N9QXY4_9NEOP|nr:unnamed protein product [Diatraea saccharalis]